MLSFEFDIEQDALMSSFLLFAGTFVEKLSWGRLLDRGCLSERGTDTNLTLYVERRHLLDKGVSLKGDVIYDIPKGQLNLVAGYD